MKTAKTVTGILLGIAIVVAVIFYGGYRYFIENPVKYKVYSNSHARFETKLPEDVSLNSSDMIYNGRPLKMYNYNSVDNKISYEVSHFTIPEDGAFNIDTFVDEVNDQITEEREKIIVNENQYEITINKCTGESIYDCRRVLVKLFTRDRDLTVSYKVFMSEDRCYLMKMIYDQNYNNISEKEMSSSIPLRLFEGIADFIFKRIVICIGTVK